MLWACFYFVLFQIAPCISLSLLVLIEEWRSSPCWCPGPVVLFRCTLASLVLYCYILNIFWLCPYCEGLCGMLFLYSSVTNTQRVCGLRWGQGYVVVHLTGMVLLYLNSYGTPTEVHFSCLPCQHLFSEEFIYLV